ncbi:MAG: adenosine kinase [Hyphomicrobium sp.]|uniref:adenosine kinase n=1 Tax=Hyphomicrobium sp. TaxID=82 RepID=UPI001323ED74|nr:adenosine kinase [Hyphomicrobium sp.]KAB2944115.1 MAG: adenosine kinase [Hyphomicrobium sp.]MBZ0209412.1 adenosine kinase [Hyphomicrobium sp.]MCZ7593931.1 adenosine kinase [Hyphomicrobium sp.]
MQETRYDVVGIGNAIVDIIGRCDDGFLSKHDLAKGFMRLIDAQEADRLYGLMGPSIERSGGSAANTVAGLASFGGRGAFIGRVADDQFGKVFWHDIRAAGVAYDTNPATSGLPTAVCLILVTPDGERTMNTFLGASTELGVREVDAAMIAASKVTYLEGYLFDKPEAKEAFYAAAGIAAKAGRKTALSLSDAFCVDRHRADFRNLVKNGTDILFANEKEITALYEVNSFEEAVAAVRGECEIAVLTRSEAGSLIVTARETVQVRPVRVDEVVDATGAGDLYASGFLYGYTRNLKPADCGRLGSLAAAEVISHIGARPEQPLSAIARQEGLITR